MYGLPIYKHTYSFKKIVKSVKKCKNLSYDILQGMRCISNHTQEILLFISSKFSYIIGMTPSVTIVQGNSFVIRIPTNYTSPHSTSLVQKLLCQ